MTSEISSAFIKVIAKEIFSLIVKLAKSSNKNILINTKNIEDALIIHSNTIAQFSREISFKELAKPMQLGSAYVSLDLSIRSSEKNKLSDIGVKATEAIEKVFAESDHNIILKGAPGAGKTTTLKYICQKLLTEPEFLGSYIKFPIFIRFRQLGSSSNRDIPLFDHILNVFGIIFEHSSKQFTGEEEINQLNLFKKNTAITILDLYSPLLILDGLDEVVNANLKDKLINNIKELSLATKNAKFILTTRTGDDLFHIEKTQSFELSPLNEEQINEFSNKWLAGTQAAEFQKQLKNSSVYDSATRPLTLSHLCAIFQNEGKIPEKSRSIYRKIVNLLVLQWNNENQLNRISKFSHFDPDRKKDFLENLSFELTSHFNRYQFSTKDLEQCYKKLHEKFNLPYQQMNEVLNEIQIHNGLLNKINDDIFEFAHKSFQEYLCAEYLVKLPKLPIIFQPTKFSSEMALVVTLSSEPSEYLGYFINEYLIKAKCDIDFLKSFFTRIKIEAPDFYESQLLGLAVLKIQDKYCKEITEYTNQTIVEKSNTAFNLDLLNSIFDLLLYFDNIKNSLNLVINFLDNRVISIEGDFIEIPTYNITGSTMIKGTYLVSTDFRQKVLRLVDIN